MEITPQNLNLFFSALETSSSNAYSVTEVVHPKIATQYPVSTEQWVDGWIGMLDTMREWKGSRIVRNPAPQTYTVPIQNFELTEGIDLFKLQDDTHGIYYPTVANMGMSQKKWPDYQLRDLIENAGAQTGSRQKGTDLVNNWSANHPVNFYNAAQGNFVNDFGTGGVSINGVLTGGGLTVNGFSTVWQEMAARKSESNEKLGLIPDVTMVPTQLRQTAVTILQAGFYGVPVVGNLTGMVGATENVLKSWSDVLMWPDLSSPTAWYQLVTNKPVKPFAWLMRLAPDFVIRNRPDDPIIFDTHTVLYGTMARGAPAWRFPWLSSRSGI